MTTYPTNLSINSSMLNDKSDVLGRNTAEIMLINNKLQIQNEQLGEEVTRLILHSGKLQEQLETLAKAMISNELKK